MNSKKNHTSRFLNRNRIIYYTSMNNNNNIIYDNFTKYRGGNNMPKDSQIDKKEVRMEKCNHQVSLASEEGKNNNRTMKRHSLKREGTQSPHINNQG